jgi:hypothetical protein
MTNCPFDDHNLESSLIVKEALRPCQAYLEVSWVCQSRCP